MNEVQTAVDPRLVAAALQWWDDMGVDTLVEDAPQPWLGRVAVASPPSGTAPIAARAKPEEAPAPAALPATLDAFMEWLATDASVPEAGPPHLRLRPFGTPGAAITIITDMPEMGDAESGALFSGEVGRLFDRMLAAIGMDRDKVYCFALTPGRPPTGQTAKEALPRLGEIAKHHLGLVNPQAVWLLGQSTSRALLGLDATNTHKSGQKINHIRSIVPAIASSAPRLLLQNPQRKAAVWQDMQMLVGGQLA